MTHQTKDKDFTPKNPLLSADHYIIPAFSPLQPLWKLYRTEDSHFRESHNFSHGFLQPRSKTSSLKEPMSTSSAPYRQTTASWNAQYFVDFSTVSATIWLRDLRKGQKRGGKRRGTELDCKKRKMKTKESAEHLQEHPGYFQCAPLAPENRLRFSLCSENGSSSLALLLLCQFKLLSAAVTEPIYQPSGSWSLSRMSSFRPIQMLSKVRPITLLPVGTGPGGPSSCWNKLSVTHQQKRQTLGNRVAQW